MENGAGVCSTETGNGGEDVCSSKESDASSADHLLVMVHGILGRYSFFVGIHDASVSLYVCVVFFSLHFFFKKLFLASNLNIRDLNFCDWKASLVIIFWLICSIV